MLWRIPVRLALALHLHNGPSFIWTQRTRVESHDCHTAAVTSHFPLVVVSGFYLFIFLYIVSNSIWRRSRSITAGMCSHIRPTCPGSLYHSSSWSLSGWAFFLLISAMTSNTSESELLEQELRSPSDSHSESLLLPSAKQRASDSSFINRRSTGGKYNSVGCRRMSV